MFAGHFAVGLVLKSLSPKAPASAVVFGAALPDILCGVLVLAGVEHATPDASKGPYLYFRLSFIDWDHSLLMTLALALVWAAAYRRDVGTAMLAGLAVCTHFLLDLPVHDRDLALYPFSPQHFGLGLWTRAGELAWFLEIVLCALAGWLAWHRSRARSTDKLWPIALVTGTSLLASPFWSPMKLVATMREPAAHMAFGAMTALGFAATASMLTWLLNRDGPAAISELGTELREAAAADHSVDHGGPPLGP